jgi:hypothetical protein
MEEIAIIDDVVNPERVMYCGQLIGVDSRQVLNVVGAWEASALVTVCRSVVAG